ncbi:hypothetical protein NDU88_006442 [Pleurodeles waltl]|uniref:Uncharacterized protein n=1 Tax=Pleurodeles waltl TaxID=8319 RepID=A0AAV7NU37_PLEWA|nr:hypothetical protein NDU88_006442 [Pleurodeles waltl]
MQLAAVLADRVSSGPAEAWCPCASFSLFRLFFLNSDLGLRPAELEIGQKRAAAASVGPKIRCSPACAWCSVCLMAWRLGGWTGCDPWARKKKPRRKVALRHSSKHSPKTKLTSYCSGFGLCHPIPTLTPDPTTHCAAGSLQDCEDHEGEGCLRPGPRQATAPSRGLSHPALPPDITTSCRIARAADRWPSP